MRRPRRPRPQSSGPRTACRRTPRGDRMPAAPAAGRSARGAAARPPRSRILSAATRPCRRRSRSPSGSRRRRAAAPAPATGSAAPRRRRCRGSARPRSRRAATRGRAARAALRRPASRPRRAGPDPARNVKTASTRGVSCSVEAAERRAGARDVRAALPDFVGDEADERDRAAEQVVHGAKHDERRKQLAGRQSTA